MIDETNNDARQGCVAATVVADPAPAGHDHAAGDADDTIAERQRVRPRVVGAIAISPIYDSGL